MSLRPHSTRRGVAIIWLLVVLVILTSLMSAITWQHVAGRRWADRRQRQLQAEWLARAGVELAVAQLLTEVKEQAITSTTILPGSEVRVTVRRERAPELPAAEAETFVVTSESRCRTDDPPPVVRVLSRHFRRLSTPDHVRVEHLRAGSR